MQANIEETSPLRRKLTVELEPDEIHDELERAYRELRNKVQMKGFRPGRAPRKLLERFFGDQVRGEVIQKLITEYMEKALRENNLEPVVAPEIVTEETDLDKVLRFNATFDVKPRFELKDYQGLKIQEPHVEVKDDEVEAALERLRERHAVFKKVEDRTVVAQGDFVLAAVDGYVEGKLVDDLRIGERMLRASAEELRHGLEEALIGAEVGKVRSRLKTYPPDYYEKQLADKPVEWRASVKEIFTRELPPLDDEFAKDQGEFGGLGALRDKVRATLLERAQEEARERARQGLVDLLIERNPIEVPDSLVTRELGALQSSFAASLEMGGMTREQARAEAESRAEELRARAERNTRSIIILDCLAEQEKVEVSDEEVAERVVELVSEAGSARERVAQHYADEENRKALKHSLRRKKALDLIFARACVEEPSGEDAAQG